MVVITVSMAYLENTQQKLESPHSRSHRDHFSTNVNVKCEQRKMCDVVMCFSKILYVIS